MNDAAAASDESIAAGPEMTTVFDELERELPMRRRGRKREVSTVLGAVTVAGTIAAVPL